MQLANKNKKIRVVMQSILSIILLISFVLGPAILLAQEGGQATPQSSNVGGQVEIKELSSQIKSKQDDIESLRNKIKKYQKNLEIERSKASSLKNQIYILETQIEKKQAEIELNQKEIDQTDLEINKTKEEIALTRNNIKDKQSKLASFLRELYRGDQKNDLEIVIMNDSISDFFQMIQATEALQAKVTDNLQELRELKAGLEVNKANMEDKSKQLESLKEQLLARQDNLADQKYTKQFILSETKNSERKYANMVAELKAEQNKINNEIVALERTIRDKLNQGGSKLSDLGDVQFSWPVPSRHITAYFHDPDYPFRHIFEHPAIDIRAAQGTPLRAAASGYVGKTKDGGKYGYSYIMLIHNNNFSTVYGHVNKIYVKPDQFVTQGEVIGATGGMPGTRGAGRLTTGPHLHFEVRQNGIPVNPLDYLP